MPDQTPMFKDFADSVQQDQHEAPGNWIFWAPIVPEATVAPAIYLKVPSSWHASQRGAAGLCLAIVENPSLCSSSFVSQLRPCASDALWEFSAPSSFLGFKLARPMFTTGENAPASAHNHSVCLWAHDVSGQLNQTLGHLMTDLPPRANPILLGSLKYYPMPSVRFHGAVERVGVRTFLNPGWGKEFSLECQNCTGVNRVAVRPVEKSTNCRLVAKQISRTVSTDIGGESKHFEDIGAAAYHKRYTLTWPEGLLCEAPEFGPCDGYVDSSFSIGRLQTEAKVSRDARVSLGSQGVIFDAAKFSFEDHARLAPKKKRHLFHSHSAVCFYPDTGTPHGLLVGWIGFHMDGPDMQAFVGFVCFFGIVLPILCVVTLMLHVNKRYRCKQKVRDLRLQLQREQLERELSHRSS